MAKHFAKQSKALRAISALANRALVALNRIHSFFNFHKGIRKAAFSVLLVLTLGVVFIATFSNMSMSHIFVVYFDEVPIGAVATEKSYKTVITKIENDFPQIEGVDVELPNTECKEELGYASAVVSEEELYDSIVTADDNIIAGCVICVNDENVAYSSSLTDTQNALSDLVGDNQFFNSVLVSECLLNRDAVESLPSLENALTKYVDAKITYRVRKDDTFESIAKEFNIKAKQLKKETKLKKINEDDDIEFTASIRAFAVKSVELKEHSYSLSGNSKNTASGTFVETVEYYYVDGVYYDNIVSARDFISYVSESESTASKQEDESAKAATSDKKYDSDLNIAEINKLIFPVSKSGFSYISAYWGDNRGHKGIDFAASTGTDIYSVLDGVVESVNMYFESYGYNVLVDHGNGFKTRYAHCSKLYVDAGDVVYKGQKIAAVGSTGRSTGPHLHFEVIIDGIRVNPAKYFDL